MAFLLLGAVAFWAGNLPAATRTTASYAIITDSLDSGGAGFSPSYANRAALEPVVGYSGATIPDSTTRFLYHGFIPQLDAPLFAVADVAVSLTATPILSSPGEVVTFSGAVTNHGSELAPGVVLTLTLPTNVNYTGATLSQGTTTLAGNLLQCSLGTIAANDVVAFAVQVTPTANGSALVSAVVRPEAVDAAFENNAVSAQSTVVTAVVFTRPGGGSWYNPANWTPAVVPTTNHLAVVDGDIVDFYDADATVAGLRLTGGRIGGAHRLTVTTLAEWSGGELQSGLALVVAPGGMLRVSNGSAVNLRFSAGIENHGLVRLENTALQSVFGAWVTNHGVFEIVGPQPFLRYENTAFNFQNLLGAVFRKRGSIATASIPVSFRNDGLIEVLEGVVDFNGSFVNGGFTLVNTGTNRAAAGAEIRYTKANSFESGTTFEGPGLHRIVAATMGPVDGSQFLGAIRGDFEIANGIINGSFTNTGHLLWTGGNLVANGPRTLTIPPDSRLTIAGGGTRALVFGYGIQNLGTVRLGGASVGQSGGGSIDNHGWLELAGDYSLGSGLVFTNRVGATLRKSAGVGISSLDANGFRNEGSLDLRSGTLALNGNYVPAATASLNNYVGGTIPGAQFSRLTISGVATLNGSINVILTNGFLPTSGDSFAILTAAPRIGTFTTFAANPVGNGLALLPVYQPAGVMLQLVPGATSILNSSVVYTNGQLRFAFQSGIGGTYVTEATVLLGPGANWISLATNVANDSLTQFLDADAGSYPTRFYRVLFRP